MNFLRSSAFYTRRIVIFPCFLKNKLLLDISPLWHWWMALDPGKCGILLVAKWKPWYQQTSYYFLVKHDVLALVSMMISTSMKNYYGFRLQRNPLHWENASRFIKAFFIHILRTMKCVAVVSQADLSYITCSLFLS